MLLIIGIHSVSVTCYDSIHVIFFLLPTCNIYRDLTVLGRVASSFWRYPYFKMVAQIQDLLFRDTRHAWLFGAVGYPQIWFMFSTSSLQACSRISCVQCLLQNLPYPTLKWIESLVDSPSRVIQILKAHVPCLETSRGFLEIYYHTHVLQPIYVCFGSPMVVVFGCIFLQMSFQFVPTTKKKTKTNID